MDGDDDAGGAGPMSAPFRTEHRIRVGDDDVHVVDFAHAGATNAPVLVLHGFPTCSADWAAVLPVWGGSRRVVALDFPGYGRSTKHDRRYSLFEQADVVEALARELGLDRVVLVSHDMGDSVAGELCARSLDGALAFDIAARVVVNGSIYLDLAQLTDGQRLLESLPDEMLADGLGVDAVRSALRATLAPDAHVDAAVLTELAELVCRDDGDRLLPRLIRYLGERRSHEPRWTGAIESHPAPLTVVWGDRDPIAVWPMAQRLATRAPHARVVRLRGVGHYPMVEAPVRFVDAVAL